MMCGDPVFSANREMQSRFAWDPLIQLMMAFLLLGLLLPFFFNISREQINKIEKFLCTFGSSFPTKNMLGIMHKSESMLDQKEESFVSDVFINNSPLLLSKIKCSIVFLFSFGSSKKGEQDEKSSNKTKWLKSSSLH